MQSSDPSLFDQSHQPWSRKHFLLGALAIVAVVIALAILVGVTTEQHNAGPETNITADAGPETTSSDTSMDCLPCTIERAQAEHPVKYIQLQEQLISALREHGRSNRFIDLESWEDDCQCLPTLSKWIGPVTGDAAVGPPPCDIGLAMANNQQMLEFLVAKMDWPWFKKQTRVDGRILSSITTAQKVGFWTTLESRGECRLTIRMIAPTSEKPGTRRKAAKLHNTPLSRSPGREWYNARKNLASPAATPGAVINILPESESVPLEIMEPEWSTSPELGRHRKYGEYLACDLKAAWKEMSRDTGQQEAFGNATSKSLMDNPLHVHQLVPQERNELGECRVKAVPMMKSSYVEQDTCHVNEAININRGNAETVAREAAIDALREGKPFLWMEGNKTKKPDMNGRSCYPRFVTSDTL